MGMGILICGLSGCGKSTLGRALAEKTGFHFIDNENLYFPGRKADSPYAQPKSREEAEGLLMDEVREHADFIFAAVKGDYGKEIIPMYSYAVAIEVPREVRVQRIRNRSFQKFGQRMLAGGDLYEQEESFLYAERGCLKIAKRAKRGSPVLYVKVLSTTTIGVFNIHLWLLL